MDNDERIRKWRDERGGRNPSANRLDRDPVADSSPHAERSETGAPAQPAAELPDDFALEEARIAILERRRLRWHLIARRVLLFVAIPLLVILLYIGLVATPLYQGEAVFTVQTSSSAAPAPTAGIFSMGGGGSTISDAFKAREFILSRPMMEQMEKQHGFMSHFASSKMDPLTRFQSPLGINQDPYAYYLKRVRVAVDVQEGILHLYVQARSPEDAVRFGNAILAAAEAHVNAFSEKISSDQISALSRDVQNAEQQVADTRRSLAAVQARRGELSPEATATAVYQLISQLELQLAEAKRQRDALLDQGLTNSPLLPQLTSRVEELQAQIAEQRKRLISPGGGSIARTLNEYEGASARKEIAQARWQSTLTTLQQAYLRILEDRRYFVIVVGMSAAAFPAVRDVLTIAWPLLGLLALIYAIVLLARKAAGGDGESVRRMRLREVMDQWRRR